MDECRPVRPCCCQEQRIVRLTSEGQEFHGFSIAEILELMHGMGEVASSVDSARWSPGGP